MDNLTFLIIIIVLIIIIYNIHYHYNKNESFENLLTLNPDQRCNILGQKKFMIRDIRTNLWLTSGQYEGFSKFLPGKFGVLLLLSEKPEEYLPLRILANPNDYLLASYNGEQIREVTNPTSKYFILEVCIYNGYNIIGYINEAEKQLYIYIDDNGNITSTLYPKEASRVEIIVI